MFRRRDRSDLVTYTDRRRGGTGNKTQQSSTQSTNNRHRRGRNMRRQNNYTAESKASISQNGNNQLASTIMVGTEAIAQVNMERNAKDFRYPSVGFVSPIEHSLLYNMIKEPKIYPREIIIQHIIDEDFSYYLEIREPNSNTSNSSNSNNNNDSNNNNNGINRTSSYDDSTGTRTSQNSILDNNNNNKPNNNMNRSTSNASSASGASTSSGNEMITTTTNEDVDDDDDDDDDDDHNITIDESETFHKQRLISLQPSRVSYAQLSALLALSAEYYPPTDTHNVSEILGKTIIKFIIKYCNEQQLDRSIEIQELLQPVESYAIKRSANAELQAVVPLYAGYTASLLTANPIPVIVGFTMWNKKRIETERELRNLQVLKNEQSRRSNVETSSLLDEMDDEY